MERKNNLEFFQNSRAAQGEPSLEEEIKKIEETARELMRRDDGGKKGKEKDKLKEKAQEQEKLEREIVSNFSSLVKRVRKEQKQLYSFLSEKMFTYYQNLTLGPAAKKLKAKGEFSREQKELLELKNFLDREMKALKGKKIKGEKKVNQQKKIKFRQQYFLKTFQKGDFEKLLEKKVREFFLASAEISALKKSKRELEEEFYAKFDELKDLFSEFEGRNEIKKEIAFSFVSLADLIKNKDNLRRKKKLIFKKIKELKRSLQGNKNKELKEKLAEWEKILKKIRANGRRIQKINARKNKQGLKIFKKFLIKSLGEPEEFLKEDGRQKLSEEEKEIKKLFNNFFRDSSKIEKQIKDYLEKYKNKEEVEKQLKKFVKYIFNESESCYKERSIKYTTKKRKNIKKRIKENIKEGEKVLAGKMFLGYLKGSYPLLFKEFTKS